MSQCSNTCRKVSHSLHPCYDHSDEDDCDPELRHEYEEMFSINLKNSDKLVNEISKQCTLNTALDNFNGRVDSAVGAMRVLPRIGYVPLSQPSLHEYAHFPSPSFDNLQAVHNKQTVRIWTRVFYFRFRVS